MDFANSVTGIPSGVQEDPQGQVLEGPSVQGATKTSQDAEPHQPSALHQSNRVSPTSPEGEGGLLNLPDSQKEWGHPGDSGLEMAKPVPRSLQVQDGDLAVNRSCSQKGGTSWLP